MLTRAPLNHRRPRTLSAAIGFLLLGAIVIAVPAGAIPGITVGGNVNTSTRAGNQAEATIAVNPNNPQQIFVASNPGTTAANSTDGGGTWNQFVMATGPSGDGLPQSCCDNVAEWDNFGNLFLTYLTFGPDGIPAGNSGDTDGNTVELLVSTTGGTAGSFNLVQQIDTGNVDQPSVAIGPGNSPGTGSVWVTWNDGTIKARGAQVSGLGTANIGAFTTEQAAPGANGVGGQFGDIAVGPGGQVTVTYQSNTAIFTNTDTDGLGSGGFGSQVNVTATNVAKFDAIPPQSSRTIDAEANLAYDRSGGPNNGRLYLSYTNEQPDESGDTDIFVRSSDDSGANWSAATQVNDDSTTNSQFLPEIAIDQTSGLAAVTWHDARNDAGAGGPGDTNGTANDDAQFWGTASDDGGATWAPNVQISAGTSNAAAAGSGVDYGDYTGSDFTNGTLHPVWADNSNSTGDNPNGALNQFDIYTARVLVGNRPPTADADGPYTTDEGADVTLDGTASSDPDGDSLTFEWDLDDDGVFGETGASAASGEETGSAPTFTDVGQDDVLPVCLRTTDPSGESDTDCSTVTVTNVDPSVAASSDGPEDEGSVVTVSGSVSDPGWEDTLSGTIDWGDGSPVETLSGTLENARPDATLSFTATHTYGDDGVYPVEVCGSDDDATTCATISVDINNVAPTVTIDTSQVTSILEGETVDASAMFTDPGWLDTYTATVDWGHPELGTDSAASSVTTEGPPQDEGEVTASRQYGDNGSYTVTVSVSDDDTGSGGASFTLTVDNVNPTAAIDTTGATLVDGTPTFLAHAGEDVDFSADSADPGSDDLTLTWDFDDATPVAQRTSLVNPPATDPLPSPSVQPRSVSDTQTHAFGDACTYEPTFTAEDDDGGSARDLANVVVTGNADRVRSAGYWNHQYSGNGQTDFGQPALECYSAIAGFMSKVFNEETDASTIEKATSVLEGSGPDMEDLLDRQLLASWLNFANGAVDLDTSVDTDGDGTDDAAFGDVVANAETVRLDATATRAELEEQKDILETINEDA